VETEIYPPNENHMKSDDDEEKNSDTLVIDDQYFVGDAKYQRPYGISRDWEYQEPTDDIAKLSHRSSRVFYRDYSRVNETPLPNVIYKPVRVV
jgi:hypothetical protein